LSATPVPLTRRQERLAVGALTLGAFAMALNSNVMAPLRPFLATELEIDKEAWGSLLSIAGIAGAVAALLLGPTVDRWGRRPPMLIGCVVFVIASAMHLAIRGYQEFFVARLLAGLGGGMVYVGASAAVADLVPYERRGAAMGLFSAGIFLALPVGLPLANVLAQAQEWRWIFGVQALFGLLTAVAVWFLIPSGLGRSGRWVSQLAVLRAPMVFASLLSVLLYTGAFFTTVQFSGEWLHESAILPRERQAMMWIVLGVCSAIGSLVLPRWSDRLGKRAFVLLTTGAVAISLVLLSRVTGVGGLLVVGVALTLLTAARMGPFQALMSEIVPADQRGVLMGIRSAAVNLGMGLTAFGASLYAAFDYQRLLYAAAAAVAVSYALVRFGMRGQQ
jgi:multidrug resistance protein